MKTIIITGTPGTGKTTLSKQLAKKLNLSYIDANLIIRKYNLSEGYDRKRKTKIIDTKKLNQALIKEIKIYNKSYFNIQKSKKYTKNLTKSIKTQKQIKNGIIIDSHLSHCLPNKYVDLCIVTKCSLKTLEKRLKKKKYDKSKIRENLDAEIFDICLNEAKENKHTALIIDTTKGINISKISARVGGFIGIKQS